MNQTTKEVLKILFFLWLFFELIFAFYPQTEDRLFKKYYEPLNLEIDTMHFDDKFPEKKLGFEAYQKGNFKLAKRYLIKAFEVEPTNIAIVFGIGRGRF